MFSVTPVERQYPTYILADQSTHSQIEVVPSRGGIVTSWKIGDREVFYLDAERFTHPDLSVRGGIPILFPICGNLPDNSYTYNGNTYQLKQHGFARDLPWQVGSQSTENGASLSLILTNTAETLVSYPFEFQVTFTYTLQGNSLAIAQEYKNLSSQPMPFSAGLHPYFAASDKSKLTVEIPGTEYFDKGRNAHNFAGSFDFEQTEIDVAFEQLSGHSSRVIDRDRHLAMTLTYDQYHPVLVFWAVNGKDFYCLEPWTAPRNAMNSGENLITLEPNQSMNTLVTLAIANI
jgi:galactose mutarotase-like enzyme